MNPKYRISDFLHTVAVSETMCAVYNALSLGVIFLEKTLATALSSAPNMIIDMTELITDDEARSAVVSELEKRRLIFPLGERYDLTDYLNMQNLLKQPGYSILYLLTSDACNLRCRYCYIEENMDEGYAFSVMSEDTAKKAIDYFAAHLKHGIQEPSIIFYGGEPLMNKKLIYFAIDYIAKLIEKGSLPKDTEVMMNTNGTLIDEEFASKIQGSPIEIALSLDGTKDMHDQMRRFPNESGSHDKVMEAATILKRFDISFGFSVTITKVNIEHLTDIILWLKKEFDITSIGFNLLIDRCPDITGMTEMEYAELSTQKLIECFELCRELGIYEDRIMRKVEAFLDGYPYIYDCGAPGDQLVFLPNALVGVCQAYCGLGKNFITFEELNDQDSEHELWKEWRYRSPLYLEQCYSCIAMGICGGGCPYGAEMNRGSIWELDEAFCVHAKRTTEYLISQLFKSTFAQPID